MSEHYYGNVGAGNEPEVCCAVKDNRTDLPFCPGLLHTCFEEPNHKGPHECGHHHSSTHYMIKCTFRWENK